MIRNRIGFLWESDVLLHYQQAARTHQEPSFWPVVVVVLRGAVRSTFLAIKKNEGAVVTENGNKSVNGTESFWNRNSFLLTDKGVRRTQGSDIRQNTNSVVSKSTVTLFRDATFAP